MAEEVKVTAAAEEKAPAKKPAASAVSDLVVVSCAALRG